MQAARRNNDKKAKPNQLVKFIPKPICHKLRKLKRLVGLCRSKMPVLEEAIWNCVSANKAANMKMVVGKKLFKCNVSLLRKFCRGLTPKMAPGAKRRISKSEVTSNIFALIYLWMTNECVYCRLNEIVDMFIAAEYMKAKNLILSLYQCFSQNKYFSELNAFKCYLVAYEKGVDPLMYLMRDRISNSFLIVVSTSEYCRFQIGQVCELLSSNFIAVQTEIEVFYAALLWLMWDYKNRHKYIKQLSRVIRFKSIPSNFILHWAGRLHELPQELAIELWPMLSGAMAFHQEAFFDCFEYDLHLLPNQRKWIRDNDCPYLELLDQHVAYEMNPNRFVAYLKTIKRDKRSFMSRIVSVNCRDVECLY